MSYSEGARVIMMWLVTIVVFGCGYAFYQLEPADIYLWIFGVIGVCVLVADIDLTVEWLKKK